MFLVWCLPVFGCQGVVRCCRRSASVSTQYCCLCAASSCVPSSAVVLMAPAEHVCDCSGMAWCSLARPQRLGTLLPGLWWDELELGLGCVAVHWFGWWGLGLCANPRLWTAEVMVLLMFDGMTVESQNGHLCVITTTYTHTHRFPHARHTVAVALVSRWSSGERRL